MKPFDLYVNYPVGSVFLSHLGYGPIRCYTDGDLQTILDADANGYFITASKPDASPTELPVGAVNAIESHYRPWLTSPEIDFIDWL